MPRRDFSASAARSVAAWRARGTACCALALAALALAAGAARAQDFPNRQVTVVVTNAAGGPSDVVARKLAAFMAGRWNQPVVVENRAGANGLVGAQYVARAKADGYTLLLGVPSLSTLKILTRNPTVDTERDLVAISQILEGPYVLTVHASTPVNSMQEFIQYARTRPGKLNYAGIAGGQILAAEYLLKRAGIELVRIPYGGAAPSLAALGVNDVQLGLNTVSTVQGMISGGKLKPLMVTSRRRLPSLPNVPTPAESGLGDVNIAFWFGINGPAGVPLPVQEKIAAEVAAWVRLPETVDEFARAGYLPVGSSPRQFAEVISGEIKLWAEVAKYARVEPE